jgi:hypothetical protein
LTTRTNNFSGKYPKGKFSKYSNSQLAVLGENSRNIIIILEILENYSYTCLAIFWSNRWIRALD